MDFTDLFVDNAFLETQMRKREEELNMTVEQLETKLASSLESFQKEEALKLVGYLSVFLYGNIS